MRISLLVLASIAAAAPAAAQPARPIQVPPELTDPAMAARIGDMMGALTEAFLDMPVGGIQAAVEGRTASPLEKRMTVRDIGRRDDPDFDRKIERQVAQTGPMIDHGMRTMAQALPAMVGALSQVAEQIERAAENMPRPDYPRR